MMTPENHVDPPDVGTLIRSSPDSKEFWSETGRTISWLRYLWVGPKSNVILQMNSVFPGAVFSPQSIYQGIIAELKELRIPGVVVGPVVIHESGPFSPYRVYLQIRRELSEFLICAAPIGESFFVTVRKIDHFRHVKWWHYLLVIAGLGGLFAGLFFIFSLKTALMAVALLLSLVWSIFRYSARASLSWLAEALPQMPILGSLYLRWFRPDSYFRQDTHSAFMSLVEGAIREVVARLQVVEPVRPATGNHGGPILRDIDGKR